jgi:phage gp29-like protein
MDRSGENMADSNDDEIIELTQVVDEEPSAKEEDVLELTQVAEDQDEVLELAREAAAEAETDTGAFESVQEKTDQPDLSLTQEQLEAAIERVIEKKFSRQIEKLLFEVTETVIKREIGAIKAELKKELDDLDDA